MVDLTKSDIHETLKGPSRLYLCVYLFICCITTTVKEETINLGEVCGHEEERYGQGGDIVIF